MLKLAGMRNVCESGKWRWGEVKITFQGNETVPSQFTKNKIMIMKHYIYTFHGKKGKHFLNILLNISLKALHFVKLRPQ